MSKNNRNETLSIQQDIKISNETIDEIMCTALEGGITYWCNEVDVIDGFAEGTTYAHEQISRNGKLKLYDCESEETFTLTREKFLKGLQLFLESGGADHIITAHVIDTSEIDADSADAIIQYAIFGETIYS
jgi:hypothetical protein